MSEPWRVLMEPEGGRPSCSARQAAILTELLAAQRPHTTPAELAVFRTAIEPFFARHSLGQLERATRAMAQTPRYITVHSVQAYVGRHCRRAGRGLSEDARRRAHAERLNQLSEEADVLRAPALEWEYAQTDELSDYWRSRLSRCAPPAIEVVLDEWRAAGRGPARELRARSDEAADDQGPFTQAEFDYGA